MIGSLVKMEGQNFSRDALVLESAEAATFVTLPASGRYFTAFLARDRAPAEVARELGVDIGSVTYRVKQMLRLGLIRPTQKVARRGRAIQYYRSVADSVFAPMELTPVSTVRELFHASRSDSRRTLDQSVERAWLAIGSHQGWGSHLYRPDADREVNRDSFLAIYSTAGCFGKQSYRMLRRQSGTSTPGCGSPATRRRNFSENWQP